MPKGWSGTGIAWIGISGRHTTRALDVGAIRQLDLVLASLAYTHPLCKVACTVRSAPRTLFCFCRDPCP